MNETPYQMMMYDAQQKSLSVAYLLWFFLGSLGVHRFYAGKTGTSILQLVVWPVSWGTLIVGVGFVVLAVAELWLLINAFLLPRIIRPHNIARRGFMGSASVHSIYSDRREPDSRERVASLVEGGALSFLWFRSFANCGMLKRLVGTRCLHDPLWGITVPVPPVCGDRKEMVIRA